MGYLMERTRAYRTILLCGMLGCVFSVIFFVLMLFSNNIWPLTLSFALLGKLLPVFKVCEEPLIPPSNCRCFGDPLASSDDGELRRSNLSSSRGAFHGANVYWQ